MAGFAKNYHIVIFNSGESPIPDNSNGSAPFISPR